MPGHWGKLSLSVKYLGVRLSEDYTWRHKHFLPGKERPSLSPFPQEIEVCWTGGGGCLLL